MRDTEREAETQAEGEADSMEGAPRGSPGSRPGPKALNPQLNPHPFLHSFNTDRVPLVCQVLAIKYGLCPKRLTIQLFIFTLSEIADTSCTLL